MTTQGVGERRRRIKEGQRQTDTLAITSGQPLLASTDRADSQSTFATEGRYEAEGLCPLESDHNKPEDQAGPEPY